MKRASLLRASAILAAVFLVSVSVSFSVYTESQTETTATDRDVELPLNGSVRNIHFVPNAGQWDPAVAYQAQGSGTAIWFTESGYYTVFYDQPAPQRHSPEQTETTYPDVPYLAIKTSFVDASPCQYTSADGNSLGVRHYLKGSDSRQWITDVPTRATIRAEGLYPGISLRFYSSGRNLEYDFLVDAGADPDLIRVRHDGVESMALDEGGDLVLNTAWGEVVMQQPIVYQMVGHIRNDIVCNYVLLDDHTFGFRMSSDYIRDLPLVIDPVLTFATYLGGGNSSAAYDVAIDSDENVLVCGVTASLDFPDTNALQGTIGGGDWDAFVSKLTPDGQSLLFSTYLGGSLSDFGYGIAAGDDGSVYITGQTTSSDFPTQNPIFTANTGGDAFLVKLAPDGSSMTYGTYLGGSGPDYGWDLDIGTDGSAFIVGYTMSTDFPTLAAYQDSLGGIFDVFVTKINPDGSAVAYSTYLGGSSTDIGQAIHVDNSGRAYLTGYTQSEDFPTAAAYKDTLSGIERPDIFVSRLTSTGSVLSYSTYLGSELGEYGSDIAVGGDGSMYVLGRSLSLGYPTVNPYQEDLSGPSDIVLTRFNAIGSTILYSTYLGGSGEDYPGGLQVDASGRMFVVGHTNSEDFPNISAFQTEYGGGDRDAVVVRFNAEGDALDYATYLGGGAADDAAGLAVNDSGYIWLVGSTESSDFPVKRPLQSTLGGNSDVLIALVTGDCVDSDEDGICDSIDNCINTTNPLQEDFDQDGLGDSCDACPYDSLNDADSDGYCADEDNCPDLTNPEQEDPDGDGVGTACDVCPDDFDPLQEDFDGDGIGDSCDVCPQDFFNDYDDDGWCADEDNCPGVYNPGQEDLDSNGIGDACEGCCEGMTGNVDCGADQLVTMADLTVMIDHLFISLAPLCCEGEANTDNSSDGLITMGDLTALIDHLFISLNPLPPCS